MIDIRNRAVPALTALIVAVACVSAAVEAAPKPFAGPAAGWDHTVAASPTPTLSRALETWKKSSGEYVTYMEDGALSYDDALAAVKKNIGDNGLKASVDTDRKCDGKRAHEVELTLGSAIVHQVIVDDAPGLTKITYARPEGASPAADVTSALTAYCGTP